MRYLIDRREVRLNIALARYLDDDPELRAAVVARVNTLLTEAGLDVVVTSDVTVSTERHQRWDAQPDRVTTPTPDVTMRARDRSIVLLLESKLGADLHFGQAEDYSAVLPDGGVLVIAAPSPRLAAVARQVAAGLAVEVLRVSPALHAGRHTGRAVLVTSWRSLLDARDPQGLQYPELQALALAIDTVEAPEAVDARAAEDSSIMPDVDRRSEWRRVLWHALKSTHALLPMPPGAELQSFALTRANAYTDWSYSAWGWTDAALYYEVSPEVVGVSLRIRPGHVPTQQALVTSLASALPNARIEEGVHRDDWSAVLMHHPLSTKSDMEWPLQTADLDELVADLVQMMHNLTTVIRTAWKR